MLELCAYSLIGEQYHTVYSSYTVEYLCAHHFVCGSTAQMAVLSLAVSFSPVTSIRLERHLFCSRRLEEVI